MSLLKEANNLYKEGRYDLALEKYQKLLQQHPDLYSFIGFNVMLTKKRLNHEPLLLNEKFYNFLKAEENPKPIRFFESFNFGKQKFFFDSYEKDQTLKNKVKNVLVSVVMPVYNRKKIISKAIDSVFAQAHQNFELIIIDDGSNDGTYDYVKSKYQDKRIKLYQSGHKGVSTARNIGIQNSNGDYLFYLDSDNFWEKEYLELMIASFIVTGKKTGYAGVKVIDDLDNTLGFRGEHFNWDECIKSNFVDLNPFGHAKELIHEMGGFDESLRRMVDWDMILRFTKKYPPFYAPFLGCVYLETSVDKSRISVKEPYAFKKVVQVKNNFENANRQELANQLKLKFAIKIPAPYEKRMQWGDFHYAESLKKNIEMLGHSVVLDFHGKWYERPKNADDVVIVIRGLTNYETSPGNINIMWNISHPDQVDYLEYETYDIVYVASESYSDFLNLFVDTKIKPLLQCTDTDRFYFDKRDIIHSNNLLFVGNSRNEFRKIVQRSLEANYAVDIFGAGWKQFIQSNLIKSENLPNDELRKYYGGYKYVLNDHWESMKRYGFISNRVFDVIGSGGRLMSDSVPSIKKIFDDYVIEDNENEKFSVPTFEIDDRKRLEGAAFIAKYHSFAERAKVIVNEVLNHLNLPKIHEEMFTNKSISGHESNKTKIGLILQNGIKKPTSSAYIRLFSPLTSEVLKSEFDLILLDGAKDEKIKDCSKIIVQRVAIQSIEEANIFLETVNKYNIPFFIDTDDAFSALPDSHHEQAFYSKLDNILKYLMTYSQKNIFSTQNLSLMYPEFQSKAIIIENCLDPRYWVNYRKQKSIDEQLINKKLKFLYMGTATHDADFNIVLPVLDKLFNDGYDFSLTIIGALRNKLDRPWIDFLEVPADRRRYPFFVKWLSGLDTFDLGVAPLENNQFNDCKSDIKVLDYAAIGIPALCSKVGAYQNLIDESIVFGTDNSEESWYQAFKDIFDYPLAFVEKKHTVSDYLWKKREVSFSSIKWFDCINEEIVECQPNK